MPLLVSRATESYGGTVHVSRRLGSCYVAVVLHSRRSPARSQGWDVLCSVSMKANLSVIVGEGVRRFVTDEAEGSVTREVEDSVTLEIEVSVT